MFDTKIKARTIICLGFDIMLHLEDAIFLSIKYGCFLFCVCTVKYGVVVHHLSDAVFFHEVEKVGVHLCTFLLVHLVMLYVVSTIVEIF